MVKYYSVHILKDIVDKNDYNLNDAIMEEALSHGKPDVAKVAWFERPYLKKVRQLYAGQYDEVFTTQNTKAIS